MGDRCRRGRRHLHLVHGPARGISCTGLRAVDAVAPLEAETSMPVVTSNQAMAWNAMRLAGYDAPVEGFGRLLRF